MDDDESSDEDDENMEVEKTNEGFVAENGSGDANKKVKKTKEQTSYEKFDYKIAMDRTGKS